MRKHLKNVLQRTQQSAEATSSSSAPAHLEPAQPATTTTAAPRDASYVPDITINQEAVYAVIENSKWRKACFIDGELRWAKRGGDGIGEKVSTDQTWKMRQIGDVLYLAPKEAHEGTDDDVYASNEKRVEAFLDKIATQMVAQSTKVPRPKFEEIRPFLSENLDAMVSLFARDGVIATDAHGYIENDFDNPGPKVNKEAQFTTRGYHSLMNREKDPVFERLKKQLAQALVPLGEGMYGSGAEAGQQQGYESGGSDVSNDHSRESPAYPMCQDNCWLRKASLIPGSMSLPRVKEANASSLVPAEIYTKLEPGFTRVLVIRPGTPNETIRCTLEPIEIPGVREQEEGSSFVRRQYEALSYTWGYEAKCQIIVCNGMHVSVSQGFFDALINIRLSDKSRTIWIDALCINQEDAAEKSRQVQYMYCIYRAASMVVIWLGNEANDSDFVLRAIAFVGSRKNRVAIMRRDHTHECLVQLARLIRGMETLTRRRWFFRSWIRQEVAAAPKVIVRCGSREVPWTALKRSVNCLVRLRGKYVASGSLFKGTDEEFRGLIGPYKEMSHALRFLKKDWVVGQALMAEAGDLRSIWYYHTGGMLELLMAGRAYDATDARDKVYAILGMAEVPLNPRDRSSRLVWASDEEKERPVMKVDYSASVSEVYQYTAKYLINRDENLDVLCILPTHRDSTSNDLPSWTPDWRVSLSSRPLYDNWDYISYKWGASGFTKTKPQDQADLDRLMVEGFEIARIQQLLPLFPDKMPHPPESPAGSAIAFEEGKHIRRFAQSTRGPAIVPSTAVVGDAVWILYGCKMPVVLRPSKGAHNNIAFEVVGPCFVSTIMFGETIEWLEEGQHALRLTSIVLV